MTRINLVPTDAPLGMPAGGVVVGLIDAKPLIYIGRIAHVDGRQIPHDDIDQDLLDAVDKVLTPIFGGDWPNSLQIVTGISKRAAQRDRIFKNGLPSAVLLFLGRISELSQSVYPPRAAGDLLLAAARMMAAREGGSAFVNLPSRELPPIEIGLQFVMAQVVDLVGQLRIGRNPKMPRLMITED